VSEASLPGIKDLSTAEMLLVERQCNCFEDTWDAWHEGAPPVLEEYLIGIMGPAAGVLFCELLHLELAYRRQHGERPTLDDYLPRFPDRERLVRGVFAREGLGATLPEPAAEGGGRDCRHHHPGHGQDDQPGGVAGTGGGADGGGRPAGAEGGCWSVWPGRRHPHPGQVQDDRPQGVVLAGTRAVGGGRPPGAERRGRSGRDPHPGHV
jgi:hypothetical protein